MQVEMAEAEMLEGETLGGLAGVLDGALVDAAEVVAGEHCSSAARDAWAELRAGAPAAAGAAARAGEDQVLGVAAGRQPAGDRVVYMVGER